MVRAEELPRVRRVSAGGNAAAGTAVGDPMLAARRERLAERLTLLQLELGGVFYEMAIRDHVQMDVLLARAAALQAVDTELAHVDELMGTAARVPGGVCSACNAPHARGAAFCWQCGTALDAAGETEAHTEQIDGLDAQDA
jgi:hypothetical protein